MSCHPALPEASCCHATVRCLQHPVVVPSRANIHPFIRADRRQAYHLCAIRRSSYHSHADGRQFNHCCAAGHRASTTSNPFKAFGGRFLHPPLASGMRCLLPLQVPPLLLILRYTVCRQCAINAFMPTTCCNSIHFAGVIMNAALRFIHLAGAIVNAAPRFIHLAGAIMNAAP